MEQLVNIIIWSAIVQGYLLGILFISSKEYSSWSNKLLGFFLLSLLFELTNTLLPVNSIFGYNLGQYFGLPETKILFPIFFLHYVLQKLGRVSAYRGYLRFNYGVSIAVMSITLINILLFIFNWSSIHDYLSNTQSEALHMSQQTYGFFLSAASMIIGIYEVRRYKRIALNEYSDMDLLSLDWLWRYIILLIPATFLWGAEIARIFIGFYTGEFTDWDFVGVTYFVLTIFIYIISYQAFKRNDLFALKHDESVPVNLEDETMVQVDEQLQSSLTNIMVDNQLYLKNDLTINNVASAVDTSPKKVSVCVNKAFDSNFSEWVNRYRVDEVKKRIDSGDYENLTIEAIGQDSGFKSRSAMYTAFKKFTGESPAKLRSGSLS